MWQQDEVQDFNDLYDIISSLDWKKYYQKDFRVILKSSSQRSQLESASTIQKISKKAIIDNLTDNSWEFLTEDQYKPALEVLVLLVNNSLRVMIDTSGNALHMRWYRIESGEAPIKENLAAALVQLSNWRFKTPLYDPFCGSGTILIEAAMIAKNIAPWLNRAFAFEHLWLVSSEDLERYKSIARGQQFEGRYKLCGWDIDEEVLGIAYENAKRAGLEKDISFSLKNFLDFVNEQNLEWTMVSNPPYGERLQVDDIAKLYKNIDKLYRLNPDLWGGVITSFTEFDNYIDLKNYKKRKLYNGGELCYFYGRR